MVTLSKPTIGNVAFATALNQNWTDIEAAFTAVDVAPALFGDGSDGALTVLTATTTTLTADLYCTTLDVQGTGVLETNGYRIYAKTSVTVTGTIRNNGFPGAAGVGGAGAPGNTVGGGSSGGSSFAGSGGSFYGGAGGDSVTNGGDPGTISSGSGRQLSSGFQAYFGGLIMNAGNLSKISAAGAGGGGGTANAGGGGGGGVVLVVTPSLVLNGTIEARGGNGNSNAGGGGGGIVVAIYRQKSGAGSISVAPGTGGTGATAGTVLEITP